jgi:TPR repeat protein
MFRDGTGVKQDKEEAAKWFKMAAEQGHEDAKKNLQPSSSKK